MSTHNDKLIGFEFKIAGLKYGKSDWTDGSGLVLFGQLVRGKVSSGDRIKIQTTHAVPFMGTVVTFTETFDDWLALPFYSTLDAGECSGPFCIAVQGRPKEKTILVPGTATHA